MPAARAPTGFAVADINYGGSTGYGRAYRARLRGAWGVVDVDDCCAAARHLAEQVCVCACVRVRVRVRVRVCVCVCT